MREMEPASVDAIVTDPPFAFTGGMSNGMGSTADDQFFSHWWRDVCAEICRVLKPTTEGFIWCDWRTAPTFANGFVSRSASKASGFRISQMLYHYRENMGMGTPFRSSVDMIAYLRGPKSKAPRIPNTTLNQISGRWNYGRHKHHPAEKSVDIARQLIQWASDEGALVLDPFAGSGTTGVAALLEGRDFVGIEMIPEYAETVERRLAEHRETATLDQFAEAEV
jgi:adenine-specific DNA-methyltransferase